MSEDWKNTVIETGVDTLLNHLAEEQKSPVGDISDSLGVSEDRIKDWADALEEEGFIEKSYSARKGMILRYTARNRDSIDEKMKELREKVDQKTGEVKEEMDSRSREVSRARKKLEKMSDQLEENREEEEEIREELENLQDMEDEIEERLEDLEKEKEEAHEKSVNLISRIDSTLDKIDEAESDAERFEKREKEIKKDLKALKKLERHLEETEELENELEELEDRREEAKSIFDRFKDKASSILGGNKEGDYRKIVSGTVEEAKNSIDKLEEPDYARLLELEKQGKNQQSMVEWLEGRKDE